MWRRDGIPEGIRTYPRVRNKRIKTRIHNLFYIFFFLWSNRRQSSPSATPILRLYWYMMHCNAHSCTWHGNYILRIGVVGSCVTMQHCTSNTKLRDTSHSYAIGWYGAICTILVYFFFLISHIFLCFFFSLCCSFFDLGTHCGQSFIQPSSKYARPYLCCCTGCAGCAGCAPSSICICANV